MQESRICERVHTPSTLRCKLQASVVVLGAVVVLLLLAPDSVVVVVLGVVLVVPVGLPAIGGTPIAGVPTVCIRLIRVLTLFIMLSMGSMAIMPLPLPVAATPAI